MRNKSILRNPAVFIIFGATAAFCTYACMFAFRKGITAVIFDRVSYAGISYKIWLITAQVFGYAVSKRIGVKVVSEMKPAQRALYILIFIGLAELALLGFALTPPPYNIVFLFLNGLPLGLVYGIMLGFLEGRRQTDALVAGLTASFIFASGFVKTVALTIRQAWDISEFWLPFVTGLLFVIPLLISVWMMTLLPPPSSEDRALRTERRPMNQTERRHFLQTFSVGMTILIVSYVLLSAFRDFRDNFAPEILSAIGFNDPSVFTKTESTIALGILVIMGALQLIKDNFLAFKLINSVRLLSAVLIGVSTWLFQQGTLSPGIWFTLVGLGIYGAYVPCNGLYFERLVASFRYVSTVGFIVTLADFYGYMGSIVVVLYKNFGQPNISFLDFFIYSAYFIAVVYGMLIILSFGYFQRKYKGMVSQTGPPGGLVEKQGV